MTPAARITTTRDAIPLRIRTALATLFVAVFLVHRAQSAQGTDIDFVRDVRPILSDNCFCCHGPDESDRQAHLRLDMWDDMEDTMGANMVVSPGDLAESELIARVTTTEEDMRMPPVDSGKSLSAKQVETLRTWVAEGAPYRQHWAFEPPQRPPIPQVDQPGWVRNPIDAFVLAGLESEHLRPSPAAARITLLRRLFLDLIGLPPTIEEIEAFLGGNSDDAMEHQVEYLLDSPHFGERWGRIWLDAARYADSDGFEKDKPREVWMYRDWVTGALNDDMPYDQFILTQIAGDLLPEATQDQLVATGFLRNSMINEEGGIDPEQFRMEAMFDRMDAIGKAVLGLTIQCAQCHSHKYDPLTQTDYYRMFAFLNNCHEAQIAVLTDEQREQSRLTADLIERIENQLREENPDWREQMAAWEESLRRAKMPDWVLAIPQLDSSGGQKHYLLDDGSILAQGYAPTKPTTTFTAEVNMPRIAAFRLELLNDANLPRDGPGRSIYGLGALTEFQAVASPLDRPDEEQELKFSRATADVNPPERELQPIFDDKSGQRRVTGPINFANDGDKLTAWGMDVGAQRSNAPRNAVFLLDDPLEDKHGWRITFKLVQEHGGWNSDDNQNNNLGRFRFSVTSAADAQANLIPPSARKILAIPVGQRTADQVNQLFSYWRTSVPGWREENRRIELLCKSQPWGATQLALLERDEPRQTHRLHRGDFLQPREEVSPGVPSFLHNPTNHGTTDRLAFARWLVDRRSPTTARSIVNRIWQAYFGVGFVATAEDFGAQGESPSHPELLDWLSVELMDHDWRLKHVHRLITGSATYRQSSHVTPELAARDPENRLLARGPRFRVDAELVRDIALAASGVLSRKIGGPSVYPPAPEFLFQPPSSYGPKTWDYDTGPDKYRRALYTFRFRSVPYPSLQTFDAPVGNTSCVRRNRSNTPLQALTTLNEPLFLECARELAQCVVSMEATSDAERIERIMRCCVSRLPRDAEVGLLQRFLDLQRRRFQSGESEPWPLVGEAATGINTLEKSNADELAAWTALARVVLNLDETITKE